MLRKPEAPPRIPDGRASGPDPTAPTVTRTALTVLFALLAPLLPACGVECSLSAPCNESLILGNLDLADFETVPAWHDLRFDEIHPSDEFDYWALREVGWAGGDPDSRWHTVHSGGRRAFDELTDGQQAFADTVRVYPCMGASDWCTVARHFISVRNGELRKWEGSGEVREFLGVIETATEAILVAKTHHYALESTDPRLSAVRETVEGFWIVARKEIRTCRPAKAGRYLLHVSRDGELRVVAGETIYREDTCYIY